MNPLHHPVFSFVVFLVFVCLLAFVFNMRQKRAEASLANLTDYEVAVRQGFVGTEEQWLANQPRKVRRKHQFADQTADDIRARSFESQKVFMTTLLSKMNTLVRDNHTSFHETVKKLMELAEKEIYHYRCRARRKDLVTSHLSPADIVITKILVEHIVMAGHRAAVNNMSIIGTDLMKFVEDVLRVQHLNGVLYRHKATVTHTVRTETMADSIINYFRTIDPLNASELSNTPFDYLDDVVLITNEDFRRAFFKEVVDDRYCANLRVNEKRDYDEKERLRSATKKNGRKHRQRRVKEASRRN